MEHGYICLFRKMRSNWLWPANERRSFTKCEAWLDMLMEAQWSREPQPKTFGNTVLYCGYGELLHAIRWYASRWHWSNGKVMRFFKALQNENQIGQKTERECTRITLVNYARYAEWRNANGTRAERQRNANGTELEEGKEREERKATPSLPPSVKDSLMQRLQQDIETTEGCPPDMKEQLSAEAMKVYGTDYPVAEWLTTFVYPAGSKLTAADLLEAIKDTARAGVRSANWTHKKLQGWHATGGRPRLAHEQEGDYGFV